MRRTLVFLAFLLALTAAWGGHSRAADLPLSQEWLFFDLPRAANGGGPAAGHVAVLLLQPHPGWYTYSDAKSSVGQPTRLRVELEGYGPLQVALPPGKKKKDSVDRSVEVEVYQGPTPLFVPLPASAKPPYKLKASLRLLLCTESQCLPVSLELPADSGPGPLPAPGKDSWWKLWPKALERGMAAPAAPEPTLQAPAGTHPWAFAPSYLQASREVSTLIPAILFGLLAGFLLNFMPCVLPVVSLKLSALLGGAAHGHMPREEQFREHNLFFALGVLAYFLLLSLLLGATGQAWGQTFQQPGVVLGLVTVLFALSLSLFGIYTLPIVDMKFGRSSRPRTQAFFTGVLATLLATPCSGPFLGGVLGWALLQPPAVISAVFLCIGLGMAAPYLIMVASPGLVRFLPKPGPWVASIEKGVAFFLMGTCIYLLNILPEDRVIPALILLWITALGAWLLGRASRVGGRGNALALRALALALVAAAFIWAMRPRTETAWTEFRATDFAERLGHETLFVEFTADWCPSCKVLNQAVLTQENIASWRERYDLTLVRVDLSQTNPEGEALLQALGSKSIPVLAIFPAKAPDKPIVLRDFYSSRDIRQALDKSLRR
mgnify:CR=1 FL=1